jgi:hypothetical protein
VSGLALPRPEVLDFAMGNWRRVRFDALVDTVRSLHQLDVAFRKASEWPLDRP